MDVPGSVHADFSAILSICVFFEILFTYLFSTMSEHAYSFQLNTNTIHHFFCIV